MNNLHVSTGGATIGSSFTMTNSINSGMMSDDMSEPSSPESSFDASDILNSSSINDNDVTAQLAHSGMGLWLKGHHLKPCSGASIYGFLLPVAVCASRAFYMNNHALNLCHIIFFLLLHHQYEYQTNLWFDILSSIQRLFSEYTLLTLVSTLLNNKESSHS